MNRTALALTGLMLAILTAGCGHGESNPPVFPAGGKVTLPGGKPAAGCRVEFQLVETDGKNTLPSARADVLPDGTFRLGTYTADDGAFAGEHRVIVIAPGPPASAGESGGPPPPPPMVDRKFGQFETSGLKFTVTKETAKNQFLIQVEPPK